MLKQWLAPYRRPLLWAVAAAALSVPLLLWQLWCLANIAGSLLAGTMPGAHWLWQFGLSFLLRTAGLLLKDALTAHSSRCCRAALRAQLLARLAAQGAARNRFGPDGALSTLLTEQVDALDGYISRYWPQLFLVLWTPLLIALAVSLHSTLSATLLLLTAPLVPLFMVLVGREASKASSAKLSELSRLAGRLGQFVQGLPVLRRFNALPQAIAQLDDGAQRYRQSTLAVLRLAFLSTAVLEFFSSLAIALVALYLGLGLVGELPWAQGQVPVGFVSAFYILLLAPEFYQPLRQLGNDYHAKAQAEAAALQLAAVWQLPQLAAPVAEPSELIPFSERAGPPPSHRFPPVAPGQLLLQLQHIQVGLAAQPRLQLSDWSIQAGECWLICGDSGSGKSTLLQLLAGFVEFSGQYRFAASLISPDNRQQLWPQIGYLTQTPELLAGTIADNLRLGRPHLTDKALFAALQQVGLVAELGPDLLSQPLGEQGQGLSGGQQQRLCFARLLLADQPLWLLDEPFAELDSDTVAELSALLAGLAVGRTVLIASHQQQSLAFIQNRLTLAAGRLVALERARPVSAQPRMV